MSLQPRLRPNPFISYSSCVNPAWIASTKFNSIILDYSVSANWVGYAEDTFNMSGSFTKTYTRIDPEYDSDSNLIYPPSDRNTFYLFYSPCIGYKIIMGGGTDDTYTADGTVTVSEVGDQPPYNNCTNVFGIQFDFNNFILNEAGNIAGAGEPIYFSYIVFNMSRSPSDCYVFTDCPYDGCWGFGEFININDFTGSGVTDPCPACPDRSYNETISLSIS